MGLFGKKASVVEWDEFRDDLVFWKWKDKEIGRKSRLILKPGQDAVFLYNGKVEGVFRDEGSYEIKSQIVPLLNTLKKFRFGFMRGLRAEVIFINTKDILMTWGTKGALNIPAQNTPAEVPVRAFGTYVLRVDDEMALLDNIAGVKAVYTTDDVRARVDSMLDQLLMKWITREGKDIYNLQSNADMIAKGIGEDLDMELIKIGLTINNFKISNFSYPNDIQSQINQAATQSLLGKPQTQFGGQLGGQGYSQLGGQQAYQPGIPQNPPYHGYSTGSRDNYCSNCGTPLKPGSRFCPNCGKSVQ